MNNQNLNLPEGQANQGIPLGCSGGNCGGPRVTQQQLYGATTMMSQPQTGTLQQQPPTNSFAQQQAAQLQQQQQIQQQRQQQQQQQNPYQLSQDQVFEHNVNQSMNAGPFVFPSQLLGPEGANANWNDLFPILPQERPVSLDANTLSYMNGFLQTQVGRQVQVDFLVGNNSIVQRTGILIGVGVNYILINEFQTDDIVVCDFYNIKFVRIYF